MIHCLVEYSHNLVLGWRCCVAGLGALLVGNVLPIMAKVPNLLYPHMKQYSIFWHVVLLNILASA